MQGLAHLSTTILQGWPTCPKRSWESYKKRLEFGDDNEGTDATRLGTIVHATMERTHDLLMQGNTHEQIPLMEIFHDEWVHNTCANFESFQFASDKIEEFVRRSIFDRHGETIGTEVSFLWDVITDEWYLGLSRTQFVDMVLRIRNRGGVPVASKIDRVDKIALPDGGYTLEVVDYKTNILPFTRYQIENSVQLGTYDIVARLIWPDAKDVECIYDMVRHGRFPVKFTDEQRKLTREYLIDTYRQIDAADEAEERINQYCRWCEIRDTCKAYAAVLESPLPPVLTDNIDTPEGVVAIQAEYDSIKDNLKLLESRKDELEDMLTAKIVHGNLGEPLVVGDKEIYLQPNTRGEYAADKVYDALQRANALVLLKDVASIGKTNMDRLLKKFPNLKPEIEKLLTTRHNKPSLKVRKYKPTTEESR